MCTHQTETSSCERPKQMADFQVLPGMSWRAGEGRGGRAGGREAWAGISVRRWPRQFFLLSSPVSLPPPTHSFPRHSFLFLTILFFSFFSLFLVPFFYPSSNYTNSLAPGDVHVAVQVAQRQGRGSANVTHWSRAGTVKVTAKLCDLCVFKISICEVVTFSSATFVCSGFCLCFPRASSVFC